jgi:hypothetical protein
MSLEKWVSMKAALADALEAGPYEEVTFSD